MTAERGYGPDELEQDIARLLERYPFLAADTIGHSVWGRPIHALRIGEGAFKWHFNGACHANEWITSLLLMRFVEEYCGAVCRNGTIGRGRAKDLFGFNTLWIVPMLNPDGVELVQHGVPPGRSYAKELTEWNNGSSIFLDWKANARGVDLNDQFPAHWDEERVRRQTAGPGPRDYSGPSPLSEPEAMALAAWTKRMNFDAVLALHTQGEEIYWNYRGCEPPEAGIWAERLANAAGYRAVYLEGSDAGYKDWFIHAFGRPGFTVEAGYGQNPLPLDDVPHISKGLNGLLAEALQLGGSIQT